MNFSVSPRIFSMVVAENVRLTRPRTKSCRKGHVVGKNEARLTKASKPVGCSEMSFRVYESQSNCTDAKLEVLLKCRLMLRLRRLRGFHYLAFQWVVVARAVISKCLVGNWNLLGPRWAQSSLPSGHLASGMAWAGRGGLRKSRSIPAASKGL